MNVGAQSKVSSSITILKQHEKKLEKLDLYRKALDNVENINQQSKQMQKNLASLARLIEIENLPKHDELNSSYASLFADYNKAVNTKLVSYFMVQSCLKSSELSYLLECVERVYNYYDERSLTLDRSHIISLESQIGNINSILVLNRNSYKAYNSACLFTELKPQLYSLNDVYSRFKSVIDDDYDEISQLLNKKDRH